MHTRYLIHRSSDAKKTQKNKQTKKQQSSQWGKKGKNYPTIIPKSCACLQNVKEASEFQLMH